MSVSLIQIGATILGRYAHPGDWQPRNSRTAGGERKCDGQVLVVKELDPRSVGHETSDVVARGIIAWMMSAKLPIIKIDIQITPDAEFAPRIVVPLAIWDDVLAALQTLDAPQQ